MLAASSSFALLAKWYISASNAPGTRSWISRVLAPNVEPPLCCSSLHGSRSSAALLRTQRCSCAWRGQSARSRSARAPARSRLRPHRHSHATHCRHPLHATSATSVGQATCWFSPREHLRRWRSLWRHPPASRQWRYGRPISLASARTSRAHHPLSPPRQHFLHWYAVSDRDRAGPSLSSGDQGARGRLVTAGRIPGSFSDPKRCAGAAAQSAAGHNNTSTGG